MCSLRSSSASQIAFATVELVEAIQQGVAAIGGLL